MIDCEKRRRKGGYIALTRYNGVDKEEEKRKKRKEGSIPPFI